MMAKLEANFENEIEGEDFQDLSNLLNFSCVQVLGAILKMMT
jgi:hypothetical protein